MKRLIIATVLAVLISAPGVASADYLPSGAMLAHLLVLVESAVPYDAHGGSFQEIQAGEKHKEGDVAYFVRVNGASWYLRLEEWRRRPDGGFSVTHWQFMPRRAARWQGGYLPTGSYDPKSDTPFEFFEIADMQAISKSERAQELLRRAGPTT